MHEMVNKHLRITCNSTSNGMMKNGLESTSRTLNNTAEIRVEGNFKLETEETGPEVKGLNNTGFEHIIVIVRNCCKLQIRSIKLAHTSIIGH
jgi:hypothetical protein